VVEFKLSVKDGTRCVVASGYRGARAKVGSQAIWLTAARELRRGGIESR